MNTYDPTRSGVPDTYACRVGISFWLELKWTSGGALGHPLTAPQSRFLRDINLHGGVGWVLIGSDEGLHWEEINKVGKRSKFDYIWRTWDECLQAMEDECSKRGMDIFGALNDWITL